MKTIADWYLPFPRILHPWPERPSRCLADVKTLIGRELAEPARSGPPHFLAIGNDQYHPYFPLFGASAK
jgi:hypothetical protein